MGARHDHLQTFDRKTAFCRRMRGLNERFDPLRRTCPSVQHYGNTQTSLMGLS